MTERFAEPPAGFPYELSFSAEPGAGVEKSPDVVRVGGRTEFGRVLLGKPQITDLLAAAPDAEHREFDYLEISLAVSFVPARGRQFGWARLDAELLVPEGVAPAPLVRDMFPRSVHSAARYERTFTVAPSLALSFTELADGSGPVALEYQPRIDAVGLLTDTAAWIFEGAGRTGLRGAYELFVIATVPSGTPASLRMNVTAEARGRYGLIPLRRISESPSGFFNELRRPV
jgi:hypothetical protein